MAGRAAALEKISAPRFLDLRLLEEREQPFEFRLVGLRAVFAQLEGLGVFHLLGLRGGIPVAELGAVARGEGLIAPGPLTCLAWRTFGRSKLKLGLQRTLKRELQRGPCFTPRMSESAQRLEKIESHLAHLERQYEELNQVVIEQARVLARLQKEHTKVSGAVESMEMERISTNTPKPPHYQ